LNLENLRFAVCFVSVDSRLENNRIFNPADDPEGLRQRNDLRTTRGGFSVQFFFLYNSSLP
jgi:hypothetical protein